jgi:hypothetical protein
MNMPTVVDQFLRTVNSGFGPDYQGPDPTLSHVDEGVGVCRTDQGVGRDRLTAKRVLDVVTSDDALWRARFRLSRAPTVGELTCGFYRVYEPEYSSFMELVRRPGQKPAIQVQTMHDHRKITQQSVHLNLGQFDTWVWFQFHQVLTTIELKAWTGKLADEPADYQPPVAVPAWAAQATNPQIRFGHGEDEPGACDHSIADLYITWA